MRNLVFFSYSHKDQDWLEAFQTMLKPAVQAGQLSVWDDTKIAPGTQWKTQIQTALDTAKVAVLLVSKDFLASDFIQNNELPVLLEAAQKNGATILWVYLGAALYQYTPIADYQAAHNIARPLSVLSPARREIAVAEICEKIILAYNDASLGQPMFQASSADAISPAFQMP